MNVTSTYLLHPLRTEREVVAEMIKRRSLTDRPLNEKLTLMKIMLRHTKENFKDDYKNFQISI